MTRKGQSGNVAGLRNALENASAIADAQEIVQEMRDAQTDAQDAQDASDDAQEIAQDTQDAWEALFASVTNADASAHRATFDAWKNAQHAQGIDARGQRVYKTRGQLLNVPAEHTMSYNDRDEFHRIPVAVSVLNTSDIADARPIYWTLRTQAGALVEIPAHFDGIVRDNAYVSDASGRELTIPLSSVESIRRPRPQDYNYVVWMRRADKLADMRAARACAGRKESSRTRKIDTHARAASLDELTF
jgi:hypothetical protein